MNTKLTYKNVEHRAKILDSFYRDTDEISGFRMQETDFHLDEYLRSYLMPTVGMLKVENHTVRMRKQ